MLPVARVVPLRTVNERFKRVTGGYRAFNYYSEAIWAQIQIMSAQYPPDGETEIAAIPKGLRILAMFLRALVFGALVAMTVHVSSPQSETIWTVYDTPRDLEQNPFSLTRIRRL